MRRPSPIAAVAAPVLVLASAVCAAAGGAPRPEVPYRVLAGPYDKKQVKAGIGHPEGRVNLKGLKIAVEFLEPPARAAFVKSIAPALADPFAAPPGRREIYSAFRVAFDNTSAADVVFQAGNVVMIADRKTQDFPVDLTDLYRVAATVGVADPEGSIDRIAPVMFDSSTTIPKGTRAERLLVFGPFPEKWKEFQLHFSFLQIGTETLTVSFNFHKQPSKG